MRVNSVPPSEFIKQYVVKSKYSAGAIQTGQDKTELTDGAKTFSAALKAATEMMETRSPQQTAHIEEVTQQVRNNTYSVPGHKVAAKILGF